jgi:hypothetical protein
VRKADNLPSSCADAKKSGGLNLLEPCGPVQASNGTALPYLLPLRSQIYIYIYIYILHNKEMMVG